MKPVLSVLFLIAALLRGGLVFAQKLPAASGWKGEIHGAVKDLSADSALKSATVAIYKVKDSSLVAVRLTDGAGAFSVVGLPAGVGLRLVVSYTGYESREKTFSLSAASDRFDAGTIGLPPRATTLADVIVGPPPVRMKGDTLEFNSDAFKLDSIAQVEDLLRILPGVTLWMSDGSITVNGRKISEVLVNGKPFFGSDPKIALQNLPKNIVEKIQVYQRADRDPQIKDSASILDIRLKKGKDFGYFGKLDAGYGTGGHYEADASINYFNGRNQIGAAFTSNNINKVAGDLTYVLRNNTFKGSGYSTEYRSDFSIPGVNSFTSAGVLIQHDFVDSPSYAKKNDLSGVYFFNNRNQHLQQTNESITTVNDSTIFRSNSLTQSQSRSASQAGNLKYEKFFDGNWMNLETNYQSTNSSSNSLQQSSRSDRSLMPLSQQNSSSSSDGSNHAYSISASVMNFMTMKPSWKSSFMFSYRGYFSDYSSTQHNRTSYIVNADSSQNRFVNRISNPVNDHTNQSVFFRLPNLGRLLTGAEGSDNTSIGIEGRANVLTRHNNNSVYDQDTSTMALHVNDSLSNRQRDVSYELQPSLGLGRNWLKNDPKHPQRGSLNSQLLLTEDFRRYTSHSVQAIQNLSRTWHAFTPSASLSYSITRPSYNSSARIGFSMDARSPGLQQLAPLVDNSNPSYIRYGNLDLQQQVTRNIDLSYSYGFSLPRSNYSLSSSVKHSSSNSYLSSSTVIDSLGRTQYTPVNARGYRRLALSMDLRGNFVGADANKLQIQAVLTPEYTIERSPSYVNGLFSFYDNLNVVVTPSLKLSYEDWLTVNVSDRAGWARSTQSSVKSIPLTNRTNSAELGGLVRVGYSLFLASDIDFTTNTSTASPRTAFTRWNASVSYRFFRDQTGEIKLSGLDLLHQNTALINTASDNTITHGNSNLLQRYFMLTVAWHPRKFGKGLAPQL